MGKTHHFSVEFDLQKNTPSQTHLKKAHTLTHFIQSQDTNITHITQHISKHTKDLHFNTKITHVQKNNHKTHHFTVEFDLQKKHTISDTFKKKHTLTHFIQLQDTNIPHTTHHHPQHIS